VAVAAEGEHVCNPDRRVDFELFQLGCGETLGVHQSLLALVVGRSQMLVGFRNLDVVTEDIVEADLERRDAGAGALALLDLDQVGAAVLGDVAQLVQLRIKTRADGASIR